MVWSIALAVIGVYCIFNGIKTIMTGRLTVKEEVSLKGFSQKGIRVYKLVYSVINIVAGLLIIGLGVERLLVAQNILEDNFTIKLIAPLKVSCPSSESLPIGMLPP